MARTNGGGAAKGQAGQPHGRSQTSPGGRDNTYVGRSQAVEKKDVQEYALVPDWDDTTGTKMLRVPVKV
jgi:hypothetical protein